MLKSFLNYQNLQWLDLSLPTSEDWEQLEQTFDMKCAWLPDYLRDKKHLPKYEAHEDFEFFIIRIYDMDAKPEDDTTFELTRKLAILIKGTRIVTIHNFPAEVVGNALAKIENRFIHQRNQEATRKALSTDQTHDPKATPFLSADKTLGLFLKEIFNTYKVPLEQMEIELDGLEGLLFKEKIGPVTIHKTHITRKRLSVIKRMLTHGLDIVHKIIAERTSDAVDAPSPLGFDDLKESLSQSIYQSDELLEDATHLVNLQYSLVSQKNNEVMRILTVFSAFFLPLTFIVGIYGMNFEFMPELKWIYGYDYVWILMLVTTVVIALWFRRKGWLAKEE